MDLIQYNVNLEHHLDKKKKRINNFYVNPHFHMI